MQLAEAMLVAANFHEEAGHMAAMSDKASEEKEP